MKFKFIKDIEGKAPSYAGYVVKTGDVIDLDGTFAKKASTNPNYEQVGDDEKALPKPRIKKPRSDDED